MPGTWSAFATGDFSTKILTPVLVSIGTTIVVGGIQQWREKRERRKNAVLDEVKRQVILAIELSERICKESQNHLTGKPSGNFKASQQQIGSQVKAIGSLIRVIEIYIASQEFLLLDNAFHAWTDAVTGEPYPIQRRADALDSNHHRIKQIHDAQQEWLKFLSAFSVRCACGTVECKPGT